MQLDIKVIAGAKKNFVKKEEGMLKIYLTAPAVEGKANKALIKILSKEFNIPKTRITITKGLKSRRKTVKLNGIC